MRWKSTVLLVGLCCGALSIVLGSMWFVRSDRLRDAWALFSDYEPVCERVTAPDAAEKEAPQGDDRPAGALAARRALARETLAVVEELAGEGRSRKNELLVVGVAASRRACDPEIGDSGVALALRHELADLEARCLRAAARAEVQWAKSCLGRLVPMTDEERSRRADRYGERLSAAVSREMATLLAPEFSQPRTPELRQGIPRVTATERPAPLPSSFSETSAGSTQPKAESEPPGNAEPPRIVVDSSSGETWRQIRNRQARERRLRIIAWKPLADRELGPVMELRRALGEHLETDSLAGGADICARLGDAARAADRVVVREAPNRRVRSAVERTLDGYTVAGRACSESRYAMAFVALSDADASWRRVVGVSGSSGRPLRRAKLNGLIGGSWPKSSTPR
ncbi:MAG: hypothetical protein OES47_01470 [Acidobacteriota bacterium]|nr:hypothetical protein [Acidobacteriota bacterium]